MTRGAPMVVLAALVAASTACAGPTTSKPAPPSTDAGRTTSTATSPIDPAQAARLQRIMVPLIRVMDHPMPLDHVKVGIIDDQQINAANAGRDHFFVTTGLLQKASDDRLRAVLAHELSHQDLNHTLTWLLQVSGPESGGFLATHPGTADRIDAVRKMP